MQEVRQMRSLGFTWVNIAKILNISRRTLYRQIQDTDLMGSHDITDQELDAVVQDYKASHPNDGESMVCGHLRGLGLHISRSEVRASVHRVDPSGVEERRRRAIKRRVYSVEYANIVWHMDGNHKLIRWKFVVNGAVDGYSRLVTMLKSSTNNRAETVLHHFVEAVSNYGLPKQLQTDRGGENVDTWEYMIQQRGDASVIVGSSVHNVRIERLWRDVHQSVLAPFRTIFEQLETDGVLNIDNEVDLYCLHQVFVNRINKSLSDFTHSWNNHSLSTEGSMTPLQLFHTGQSEDSSESEDDHQIARPMPADQVHVPNLHFVPCSNLTSQVQSIQQQNVHTYGPTLYRPTVSVVGQHISENCSSCDYV